MLNYVNLKIILSIIEKIKIYTRVNACTDSFKENGKQWLIMLS